MIANARTWWADRSARERWMLGVMFAMLGAAALWFAILRPLWAAADTAYARFESATRRKGDVAAALTALQAAGDSKTESLSGPIEGVVGAAAQAAGFTLSSASPQGDGTVSVATPAVKSSTLWSWTSGLAQRGVIVERMTVRTSGDGSLAVEASLRGPR